MIRRLIGDALVAAGEKVRGAAESPWTKESNLLSGFAPDLIEYDEAYQRHTKRAGWTAPAPLERFTTGRAIAPEVVKAALADLPDSELIRNAAGVIAGWKPILLSTAAAALTDLDLFIQALRDRADQFEAVEHDADEPFLTPDHLQPHFFTHRAGCNNPHTVDAQCSHVPEGATRATRPTPLGFPEPIATK